MQNNYIPYSWDSLAQNHIWQDSAQVITTSIENSSYVTESQIMDLNHVLLWLFLYAVGLFIILLTQKNI